MLPRLSFFVFLCFLIANPLHAKPSLAEQQAHFYAVSQSHQQALLSIFEHDQGSVDESTEKLKAELKRTLGLEERQAQISLENCLESLGLVDSSIGFYDVSICIVETGKAKEGNAVQVDQAIAKYLKDKGDKPKDLYLAYTYYNLAVFAIANQSVDLANSFFDKAIGFLELSEEGRALYERIWLERGYAEYYRNQFVSAMQAFEKVGLDSPFKSEALLSYGWAAFYSYNRGVALEAWRQVALQKNKSISVYEALLAIPFALEKANAFSRSLTSYQYAVSEYEVVLKQIESLLNSLSLEDIQSYIAGDEKAVPSMLPELLGVAFTRKAFRELIDDAVELAEQGEMMQRQLDQLQAAKELTFLVKEQEALPYSLAVAKEEEKVARLKKDLTALRYQIVAHILNAPSGNESLKTLSKQYLMLVRQAQTGEGAEQLDLDKLQKTILASAYTKGVLDKSLMNDLTALVREMSLLEARLRGIKETKALAGQNDVVSQERFADIGQSIEKLQKKREQHALRVQAKLLNMAKEQLVNYQRQISGLSRQAEIANARLQEEFYQLRRGE